MTKRTAGAALTTWEVLNIVEALKERAERWEKEGVDAIAIEHLRRTMHTVEMSYRVRVEMSK